MDAKAETAQIVLVKIVPALIVIVNLKFVILNKVKNLNHQLDSSFYSE